MGFIVMVMEIKTCRMGRTSGLGNVLLPVHLMIKDSELGMVFS